jgi:hypothetical protein
MQGSSEVKHASGLLLMQGSSEKFKMQSERMKQKVQNTGVHAVWSAILGPVMLHLRNIPITGL